MVSHTKKTSRRVSAIHIGVIGSERSRSRLVQFLLLGRKTSEYSAASRPLTRGVIMLRIVVVCMFLLASLFVQQSTPFSDVARSQGKKEVLPQAGTAAIEKEITVLERRILLL